MQRVRCLLESCAAVRYSLAGDEAGRYLFASCKARARSDVSISLMASGAGMV